MSATQSRQTASQSVTARAGGRASPTAAWERSMCSSAACAGRSAQRAKTSSTRVARSRNAASASAAIHGRDCLRCRLRVRDPVQSEAIDELDVELALFARAGARSARGDTRPPRTAFRLGREQRQCLVHAVDRLTVVELRELGPPREHAVRREHVQAGIRGRDEQRHDPSLRAELRSELESALVAVVAVRDEQASIVERPRIEVREAPEPRAVRFEIGSPARKLGARAARQEEKDGLRLHSRGAEQA